MSNLTPKCPICGNAVPQAKHPAWQKTYCSIRHRDIAQHNRWTTKCRKLRRAAIALTGRAPVMPGQLGELTVVTVNGQHRIKAALRLQKMMKRGKQAC